MDNKFSIGSRNFALTKLNAIKQFHIVRRIAPILTQLLPHLAKLTKLKDGADDATKLDEMATIAGPVMDGLSRLSDDDANHVLNGLLSAVEVESNGVWSKIVVGDIMMINDLELPVLMQVAGRAFAFNLSGFFAALPQK